MLTLVTGATGEVGRRLVPRLLQRPGGDRIRVLVRDQARGEPFAALGAEIVTGDLRDESVLGRAVADADAVLNVAAAFRGVPEEECLAVNRDAALALGRAALAAGVPRFVQVSTGLVYGKGRGRPHTEDDRGQPGGPLWGAYPRSKADAERGLLAMDGLDLRIGRLAYVYGEGDSHLAGTMRLVPGWAATQRLHLVHHADAAFGLTRLLYAPAVEGRIFNIADDAPVTAVDLCGLCGVDVPGALYERQDPDPWYGILSNDRIRRELGFRPLYPTVWTARDAGAL